MYSTIEVLKYLVRPAGPRVERMREEFLAVASHELKTPLTTLRLQVEMLLQLAENGKLSQIPREDLLHRLKMAERQVGRMHGITETLLEAASIRSGDLELKAEPMEVGDLLADGIRKFVESSATRLQPIQVSVDGGGTGLWDRGKMTQALRQLLANAVVYGLGRPIEVSASCRKGKARVVVRDHGMGMECATQKRLFKMFHRGVPAESYGGFGLGLYIVNEVVRAHGGRVRVQSKPGLGSRFILELPLVQVRAAARDARLAS